MDPSFWLKRWQANEIGFHAAEVQPALIKHWPALRVEKNARVLVPLCGKTLDMVWLAGQGHKVVGAELSEIAINDFVAGQGLQDAEVAVVDGYKVFAAAPFELWCGDFFAMTQDQANVSAAYDRAALVAMPPEMQPRYAAKLAELLPKGAPVLLIGLDYNRSEMQGPPFAIPHDQVHALFDENFEVTLLEALDGMTKSEHLKKRGVTRLEEATYLLRRKA